MEWQPIETAPKDGTIIIVTDGKTVAASSFCPQLHGKEYPWAFVDNFTSGPNGCCDNEDGERVISNAFSKDYVIYWMPLPEPPK